MGTSLWGLRVDDYAILEYVRATPTLRPAMCAKGGLQSPLSVWAVGDLIMVWVKSIFYLLYGAYNLKPLKLYSIYSRGTPDPSTLNREGDCRASG